MLILLAQAFTRVLTDVHAELQDTCKPVNEPLLMSHQAQKDLDLGVGL